MRKHRLYYRTKDGRADYIFSFEKQYNGTWRVYIVGQPSYQGRSTDDHSTHRISSGGRNYICWTSSINSLDDAKKVAAAWADKTQEYIRTGNRF